MIVHGSYPLQEGETWAGIVFRVPDKKVLADAEDASIDHAPADGVLPDDFYVTTNRRTWIKHHGEALEVRNVRMDCAVVVKDGSAFCLEMRRVKKGDAVVSGSRGVFTQEPMNKDLSDKFQFMSSRSSAERSTSSAALFTASMIKEAHEKGVKVAFVVGPAVIHAGGREALVEILQRGCVDVLLSGNALAVHDIEMALFGTSLGVRPETAERVDHGNHVRAINVVRKLGSIKAAVESGVVKDGVMYECVKREIPFIFAGSIRDDGPLPEVITDACEAQDAMREALQDVGIVVALASMLHAIAVGNMLPAHVKMVCVDINPAVVTKLVERGTTNITGVVTDAAHFLSLLLQQIEKLT